MGITPNRYKILKEGKDNKVLVYWKNKEHSPYSVHTWNYDKDGLVWGHYFTKIEEAKEYFAQYDLFNKEDYKKKPFFTTQSDFIEYNGKDFEIIKEQIENVDLEVQPMWEIRFSDGTMIDCFSDEIFDDESVIKIAKIKEEISE